MKRILTLLVALVMALYAPAQMDTVLCTQQAEHLFPDNIYETAYTTRIDARSGVNYVYAAQMEYGLGIYDMGTAGNLTPALTLPISTFGGLDVSTLAQRGNSLFVGIGDFQVNNNPRSGLAILDITNPLAPTVLDRWDSTLFSHGISHLLVDGDFAYLSTMKQGIFILDISDETQIRYRSRLQLDLNFPLPSLNAHNARGLKIRNDTLYVCFDRGGLRLVDVRDKDAPVELAPYINTSLNSQAAAAYNDVVLLGDYAFVTVDYCGLEVLDIHTTPFTPILWYNPWGCTTTNWNGAHLHTNEARLARHDSLLCVSGGQSDLLVFDISDPLHVRKIGEYGTLGDSLVSHGLDVRGDSVALGLLHSPLNLPFASDYGGVKLVRLEPVYTPAGRDAGAGTAWHVYPNPVRHGSVQIDSPAALECLTLYDLSGHNLCSLPDLAAGHHEIALPGLRPGLYLLRGTGTGVVWTQRLQVVD